MVEDKEGYLKNWDNAAAAYSAYDQSSKILYEPPVDELMGDVSGRRVLDAGCGDGRYSRKFNSLGADVTGIDGSSEMLSIARGYPRQPGIEYVEADLTGDLPLPDPLAPSGGRWEGAGRGSDVVNSTIFTPTEENKETTLPSCRFDGRRIFLRPLGTSR